MYVGDVHDGSGLLQVLWEVVANAIDEHLAGHASRVRVTIESDDSFVVEDDGRGIAPDVAIRALTELHDTNTLDGHHPHVHIGLHGVGLVVVNALSESLVIESRRGGRIHRARFARGVCVEPMHDDGASDMRGTRISFRPDPEIFSWTRVDLTRAQSRIDELGAFLERLSIELVIAERRMRPPVGIAALLRDPRGLHAPVLHRATIGDIGVELAVVLHDRPWGSVRTFVNTMETRDGGVHLVAFWSALRMFFAEASEPERFAHAVVHVSSADPAYGAPMRDELVDPRARRPVVDATLELLRSLADAHPDAVARVRELAK